MDTAREQTVELDDDDLEGGWFAEPETWEQEGPDDAGAVTPDPLPLRFGMVTVAVVVVVFVQVAAAVVAGHHL